MFDFSMFSEFRLGNQRAVKVTFGRRQQVGPLKFPKDPPATSWTHQTAVKADQGSPEPPKGPSKTYKGHQSHPKSRLSPQRNQQKQTKNEVAIRSLLVCVSMCPGCRFGYVKMWSKSFSAVVSWSPEDTQAPTSDPKILPTRIPRLTDDPLRPPTVSPIDPRATQGPHKVTP